MKIKHTITLIGLAVSLSTTITLAAPVGLGFGDGISFVSDHNEIDGQNRYEINGPDDGFFFDPNAGAWEKHLLAPANGFQPGGIYCVSEWFTFFPPPAGGPNYKIADWHEDISFGPDGRIWDVWTLELGPPIITFDPGGPPIPGLEFMISDDGTSLWFDFDPINVGPDGVTLHIEKYFMYTGETVGFDPVIITQYPTPAPGSLAILGLAGLMVCKRHR